LRYAFTPDTMRYIRCRDFNVPTLRVTVTPRWVTFTTLRCGFPTACRVTHHVWISTCHHGGSLPLHCRSPLRYPAALDLPHVTRSSLRYTHHRDRTTLLPVTLRLRLRYVLRSTLLPRYAHIPHCRFATARVRLVERSFTTAFTDFVGYHLLLVLPFAVHRTHTSARYTDVRYCCCSITGSCRYRVPHAFCCYVLHVDLHSRFTLPLFALPLPRYTLLIYVDTVPFPTEFCR